MFRNYHAESRESRRGSRSVCAGARSRNNFDFIVRRLFTRSNALGRWAVNGIDLTPNRADFAGFSIEKPRKFIRFGKCQNFEHSLPKMMTSGERSATNSASDYPQGNSLVVQVSGGAPGAHKQRRPVNQDQIQVCGEIGSTQFLEQGFVPCSFFFSAVHLTRRHLRPAGFRDVRFQGARWRARNALRMAPTRLRE